MYVILGKNFATFSEKVIWVTINSTIFPEKNCLLIKKEKYLLLIISRDFFVPCCKNDSYDDIKCQYLSLIQYCTQWCMDMCYALKYLSYKAEVPPIYLLIKHSHSIGSKYFSRYLYMMFALVWMHFEVNFHVSKPFGFLT